MLNMNIECVHVNSRVLYLSVKHFLPSLIVYDCNCWHFTVCTFQCFILSIYFIGMALPVWYTPLTKPMLNWLSHQGGRCRDFELDYYRCSSRTGSTRAAELCYKELDDFSECVTKSKEVNYQLTTV